MKIMTIILVSGLREPRDCRKIDVHNAREVIKIRGKVVAFEG